MEDTKSLLMMVLQKVFHNRPKIIEETFQLIYNYNNSKREKKEYEETLKTICDLMNDELSSQILVYLLTMVDMPREGGGQLPIMEKMQKTHGCLAESVRPQLLKCLKTKVTEKTENRAAHDPIVEENIISEKTESKVDVDSPKGESEDDCFLKPAKRPKKNNRIAKKTSNSSDDNQELPSLTDLCASYCVGAEKNLKKMYKSKLNAAWDMVNDKGLSAENLTKCYEVIRYLNRMMKLLRMVENTGVTIELLAEEYTDVEIFIREKHLQNFFKWDPFEDM